MSEDIKEEKTQAADENTDVHEEKAEDSVESAKNEKKKKEKKPKEKEQLEKLQKEHDDLKNQYMRVLAEYDNYRKRTTAEKTATYGNAVADTIQSLLPVADNLERALAMENTDLDAFKKGVEMIGNQFRQAFDKLNISSFGEAGDDFNPELHQAIGMVDNDELGSGKVAVVLQKGYKRDDKVIRLAMVQVTN